MAKKQDFDKDIHLSSFDDLFQTDESREDLKREKLMDIPIAQICDFPNHPYKVKDDESKGKILFTDTWIDVDVGAGLGLPPAILRLDDMKTFYCEE